MRRTLVVLTAVALVLAPAAPALAAPAPARVVAATSADLPPYATWIADVTAVTDTASAYLSSRLPDAGHHTAIVLDIDNTALESTYSGSIWPPATAPVLAVAKQAKAAGAAIFFVTNRPEIIGAWTKGNLTDVGYPVNGLYLRPTFDSESVQSLKTNARIAIEGLGYTIVANIGNNDTDLAGGHAERTFKLPDYGGLLD